MGYEQPLQRIGLYSADVDMSSEPTNQFAPVWLGQAQNIVGFGAGGTALVLLGSLTYAPFGILQNNPIQGEAGLVLPFGCGGISKAKIGGTITIGAPLTWNTAGTALIAATTGKVQVATALESGVLNDIAAVLLVGTFATHA